MYNNEFRTQAVDMAKEIGVVKAAQKLNVSEQSIYNWLKDIIPATSRGKYNRSYKTAAVKLASKIGVKAATEKLGIYSGAIYRWRNNNDHTPPRMESIPRSEFESLREEAEKLKKVTETFKDAIWLFVKKYDVRNASNSPASPASTNSGVVHTCEQCGKKYIARVPYQKYCSEQCRSKRYYARTKEPTFESIIKRLSSIH